MNASLFTHQSLTYLVRYPEGFDAARKYPTLMFLHGAGTRGSDTTLLLENPFFSCIENYREFPFVVIAPQCWADTWVEVWEQLKTLTSAAAALPFVDEDRFYCMGASMGGYGTWQLAISMPEHFAAIVPICGGGMYWNASRLMHVPVWAFHGGKDPVISPEESRKMTDAVNRSGGSAKLTIYPENDHNAWSDTYSNPEVFQWLLAHKKEHSRSVPPAHLGNPEIYG